MATVKQEFHLDEDNYYTEDEYVEEEEEEEDDDEGLSPEKGTKKKSRGRANGEPRMKMRRIFRITHGRERQRGEAVKENRCSDLHRTFSVYTCFFAIVPPSILSPHSLLLPSQRPRRGSDSL